MRCGRVSGFIHSTSGDSPLTYTPCWCNTWEQSRRMTQKAQPQLKGEWANQRRIHRKSAMQTTNLKIEGISNNNNTSLVCLWTYIHINIDLLVVEEDAIHSWVFLTDVRVDDTERHCITCTPSQHDECVLAGLTNQRRLLRELAWQPECSELKVSVENRMTCAESK